MAIGNARNATKKIVAKRDLKLKLKCTAADATVPIPRQGKIANLSNHFEFTVFYTFELHSKL